MTDDAATKLLRDAMPLCDTLHIRVETYTPERVALTMDFDPSLCTGGGLLHGGVIMALADSGGGACAFLNLPDGASGTSTIESKTNFLRGVRNGSITATSTPLHVGRSTIVIETAVTDDAGKLVAKVTQTQTVLRAS